jgi:hypothetical protein
MAAATNESQQKWEWRHFREVICRFAAKNETRAAPLLEFFGTCDRIVGRIVSRPLGIDSHRPQDYVIATLAARAFRLTTGAVFLDLSGYPNLGPNLVRTVWEIGIRLIDMHEDPRKAAYGFLLHSVSEELRHLEAEIAYRRSSGEALGFLEANAHSRARHREEVRDAAQKRGIDPNEAEERFGKLNVRVVCERVGIEKAYKTTFAFYSSFVHEKNAATPEFLESDRGLARFELGPLVGTPPAGTFDALKTLVLVLGFAADLLEDSALSKDTKVLSKELDETLRELEQ